MGEGSGVGVGGRGVLVGMGVGTGVAWGVQADNELYPEKWTRETADK